MKYCIEGDYNDNHLDGKIKIQDAEDIDFKDFIMYGMPGLIQDLFERFGKNLKAKAKDENVSYDKIIGVVSLMSIICLNNLSDKLTESLNEFLADDPEEDSEDNSDEDSDEDSEETNGNNRDLLLGNN